MANASASRKAVSWSAAGSQASARPSGGGWLANGALTNENAPQRGGACAWASQGSCGFGPALFQGGLGQAVHLAFAAQAEIGQDARVV